jgi:isocitrate dehydrogenase kinase/phosphatase
MSGGVAQQPATELRIAHGYARLEACAAAEKSAVVAELILAIFDHFYGQLCEYPFRAKRAFEVMDPHASIRISQERLGLYSRYIAEHGPRIGAALRLSSGDPADRGAMAGTCTALPASSGDPADRGAIAGTCAALPASSGDPADWDAIDRLFTAMIVDRYEADIAFSFAHSLRRHIAHGQWRPVAYAFPPPGKLRALSLASVFRRLPLPGRLDEALLCEVLQMPGFAVPFRDLRGDVRRVLERLQPLLYGEHAAAPWPAALDIVEAGFFRDRSAFLVGRWVLRDETVAPFVVGYLNSPEGIYVDAILHQVADIHNLFSSALANFHVTTRLYYQTCVFLFSLMPRRPFGHHYSTIGFNHVGKVAILTEIIDQVRHSGERLRRSPGAPGTVALGFTFDACSYHLKVIRDRPTSSYKWGAFPGVTAVLDKYREVHEINRAGSMLDNVIYHDIRLGRDLFEPALLEEICEQTAGSAQLDADGILLRSLIVQLKIVPLPMLLQSASEAETRTVIRSLGHCIRNNAATNIFNKDLDSRNYGVGRYGRVFLFDYDAVEKLTDVKIRTNTDMEPGEEDIPAWFFEDGVVFLPEELEHGMQFKNDFARRCFREENGDLLRVAYWTDVQQKLSRGEVPELRIYPRSAKLVADTHTRARVYYP